MMKTVAIITSLPYVKIRDWKSESGERQCHRKRDKKRNADDVDDGRGPTSGAKQQTHAHTIKKATEHNGGPTVH